MTKASIGLLACLTVVPAKEGSWGYSFKPELDPKESRYQTADIARREAAILPFFKAKARRNGRKLAILNGKKIIREFEGPDYSLVDFNEKAGVFVLCRQGFGERAYLVVDARKGSAVGLCCEPIWSPDAAYFAVLDKGGEMGSAHHKPKIWRWNDGDPSKEWAGGEADEARWSGERKAVFTLKNDDSGHEYSKKPVSFECESAGGAWTCGRPRRVRPGSAP